MLLQRSQVPFPAAILDSSHLPITPIRNQVSCSPCPQPTFSHSVPTASLSSDAKCDIKPPPYKMLSVCLSVSFFCPYSEANLVWLLSPNKSLVCHLLHGVVSTAFLALPSTCRGPIPSTETLTTPVPLVPAKPSSRPLRPSTHLSNSHTHIQTYKENLKIKS